MYYVKEAGQRLKIMGASEGLRTIVIEKGAAGGQALSLIHI